MAFMILPSAGHYRNETYIPSSEAVSIDDVNKLKPMWVRGQRNSWHGIEFPYHGRRTNRC